MTLSDDFLSKIQERILQPLRKILETSVEVISVVVIAVDRMLYFSMTITTKKIPALGFGSCPKVYMITTSKGLAGPNVIPIFSDD